MGIRRSEEDINRAIDELEAASIDELEDEFAHIVEMETKESTATYYTANLSPWLDYCRERDMHPFEAREKHLRRYLKREAQELANTTIGHRHSAISRFNNAIREEYEIPKELVEAPTDDFGKDEVNQHICDTSKTLKQKEDGDPRHFVSPEDVQKMIDNATYPETRNKAILLLMFETGLRQSEVVEIEHEDINFSEEVINDILSPKASKKTDETTIRATWRSDKLTNLLRLYINHSRPTFPTSDSDKLFISHRSGHMSPQSINEQVVKPAAEEAEIQEWFDRTDRQGRRRCKITSHTIRHGHAVDLLKNDASLPEISQQLHHSDTEVTEIYTELGFEERKRINREYGTRLSDV